ncbi:SpaH/EbpB family LPXTG-anchored major pilin [Leucobacter sp. HY1910]
MKRHTKRGAAVALGAAAAMLLSLFGATASMAAPANIDGEQDRTLTVHKHTSPTVADSPRGTGDVWDAPPVGAEPLAGVTFKVQQVTDYAGEKVDLRDTDGWQAIQPLLDGTQAFDPAAAGTTLATGTEKVTAGNGAATWAGAELPFGLYWVTETDPGEHKIAQPAEPFLVTVPTPREGKPGEWIYDVHTYPKNTIVTAAKTVDDSDATALGDLVTWDISSTIPANPSHGVMITDLTIIDTLPTGLVYGEKYSAPVVTETSGQAEGAQTVRKLEADEYTVTHQGGVVTMSLTEKGRQAVQANIGKTGGTVTFQFKTMVTELGAADGHLVNNAVVRLNDSKIDVDAETLFGPARITKIAEGDYSVRLDDAEFQVFDSEEAAQAANDAVERGEKPTGAVMIGVGDERRDTFVTETADGQTGSVYLPGLKATLDGTKYWLVETRSPAGYIRANQVFDFTVFPGSGEPEELSIIEISNPKRPAIAMAVTGSAQILLYTIGGAATLIAAAGAAVAMARGRRAARD